MRSQSICLNILFDRNLIKVVKINRRKREKRNREGKSKAYIQSDKRQQNTGFTLMSADCRRENAAT